MYGYIYKTTNLLNNKIYVGQKKSERFLGDEYKGSGVALLNAIAKYGKDNFKTILLETCSSKEELNQKEIFWIKELNCTLSDIGYNLIDGENGGSITHDYIWINNGIEQHQIHPEDLPLYEGFVKGVLPRGNEWKGKLKNRKFSEQHISNLKQSIKKFTKTILISEMTVCLN